MPTLFGVEVPEALRGFGCRDFGVEVSESFGALGAEVLESRCRRLFGVFRDQGFGAEVSGSGGARASRFLGRGVGGPSGSWVPRLWSRRVGVLRDPGHRGSSGRGIEGLSGLWVLWAPRGQCWRVAWELEVLRTLWSLRSRRVRACGTHVAQRASRGRLESSGRFAVSETRRRDSWRSRRWRRTVETSGRVRAVEDSGGQTSRALVPGEPGTAARKAPGGAENPRRGAVVGQV